MKTLITKQTYQPHKIRTPLIRLGNKFGDGGYIIPDVIDHMEALYSYGVGGDSSFENEFSLRSGNKPTYMYDMTVDVKPIMPNQFFKKEGLAGVKALDCNTLQNHIAENGRKHQRILLKVDIEGCEYEWIENTNMEWLSNIAPVLALEFHWVNQYEEQFLETLNKIKEYYNIVHFHWNCYGGINRETSLGGVPEITFVAKNFMIFNGLTTGKYPTSLDFANNGVMPETWEIDYSE